MTIDPRIPSGFMELLPEDQIEFNRMLDTIRSTFELFGFAPIETPAIELSEILLAKGGGETDKQVYRFMKGQTDLCLHYDLTVPLARYVAQYQHQLTFPFRRYQIQKVWRGESVQRGRFREFYQCDIDVIGSTSPLIDAEIPSVIYAVFIALGFGDFTIRINNRKVLNGFLEDRGLLSQSKEVLTIIDKLEKKGRAAVEEELCGAGIRAEDTGPLLELTTIRGLPEEVLSRLESLGVSNELFAQGLNELRIVGKTMCQLGVPAKFFEFDLSIARGLDYYTGTIYETRLNQYLAIGSVCSGGRYDDLAKYYTERDLPGVGISIGLTRLFYQLREAGLVKGRALTPSQVLVLRHLEAQLEAVDAFAFRVAAEFRRAGIKTEMVLHEAKFGKQMKYAGKLKVPFVAIIGPEEVAAEMVTLRDMRTGLQQMRRIMNAVDKIRDPYPLLNCE